MLLISTSSKELPHEHKAGTGCTTTSSGCSTILSVSPRWPCYPPRFLPRVRGKAGFFFKPSLAGLTPLRSTVVCLAVTAAVARPTWPGQRNPVSVARSAWESKLLKPQAVGNSRKNREQRVLHKLLGAIFKGIPVDEEGIPTVVGVVDSHRPDALAPLFFLAVLYVQV